MGGTAMQPPRLSMTLRIIQEVAEPQIIKKILSDQDAISFQKMPSSLTKLEYS